MTTTEGRLTPEREAGIRNVASAYPPSAHINIVLRELDAVRRERDEARKITDAMVERAALAIWRCHQASNEPVPSQWRDHYLTLARRALDAAMAKDGDT